MNYTLHQLRIFLKITQTGSITKAAEELHLTQPAVSIQLRNLQDQFEVPLTEVIGRKLYVTDFGKEIAVAAQRILDEIHAIRYKAEAYRGFLTGQLTISVVSTGKYVMPYFLSGFLQQHPGIDLNMDVTNKTYVVESLERNAVDFALVSVLPDNLSVDKVPLMANKLFLVGNQNLNFPAEAPNWQALSKVPLIFREPGSATRRAMEMFLDNHKLSVRKKLELTSNEAVKQAVLAGLGFSIMPVIGLKNELQNRSLRIISIDGLPITTDWNLVWLRKKKFSPVAEAFLKYIREEKDSIIDETFQWFEKYRVAQEGTAAL
ncbi:MAG: LysR family transcriptional regulator [Bacteroidota bacterium]